MKKGVSISSFIIIILSGLIILLLAYIAYYKITGNEIFESISIINKVNKENKNTTNTTTTTTTSTTTTTTNSKNYEITDNGLRCIKNYKFNNLIYKYIYTAVNDYVMLSIEEGTNTILYNDKYEPINIDKVRLIEEICVNNKPTIINVPTSEEDIKYYIFTTDNLNYSKKVILYSLENSKYKKLFDFSSYMLTGWQDQDKKVDNIIINTNKIKYINNNCSEEEYKFGEQLQIVLKDGDYLIESTGKIFTGVSGIKC